MVRASASMNSAKIRKLFRRPLYGLARRTALWYLRSERRFRFEGLELDIPPGVFHPGLFFTSLFLIDALRGEDLSGKTLLELGAGSGLISLWSAKRGAAVTATDISPLAVTAVERNVRSNLEPSGLSGRLPRVIHSDLFDKVPREAFDWVVINPPFYPKTPRTDAQRAWFCGKDFQYFEKLFGQIGDYIGPATTVLMLLSEDCDIPRIRGIAGRNGLALRLEKRKRFFIEDMSVFSLHRGSGGLPETGGSRRPGEGQNP